MSSIPANRQDSAVDHTLRFHDDAVSLLKDLESAAKRAAARERAARKQRPRRERQSARRSNRGSGQGKGGAGPQGRRRAWRWRGVSARNRELLALIPVAALVTGGFTAVFIVESSQIGDLSLIYGGYFLAVCLAVHLFIRARLPVRGSLSVPALRPAGGDRPGDAVSDRRRPGAQAGVDLRRRRRSVGGDDRLRPRLPRPGALPVPDRHRGDPAAPGAAAAGDRVAGQRRLSRDRPGAALLPARRGGEDLRGHLPRQLPAREAGAAHGGGAAGRRPDDPATQALRAAARGLGGRDADAGPDPRPGQLADVLRRLPGAPVRRDGALLLRGRRAGPVLRRRLGDGARGRPRRRPGGHLARSLGQQGGGSGADPAVAVRAGGRRPVRPGPGGVAAEASRARSPPTARSRTPTAAASCRRRTRTRSTRSSSATWGCSAARASWPSTP